MQKMRWFGVVMGHSRSWAMSPFDRVHKTSYSTLIETMCLSCVRVQVYSSLCHLNLQSRNPIPIPVARRRSICNRFSIAGTEELDMNLTSLKVGIHRHCSINKLN